MFFSKCCPIIISKSLWSWSSYLYTKRISPSYWRRSSTWRRSWLQRRHNKSKNNFWNNWSTKKYKSSGTDNTWGWTRLISLSILTWTHFSTGSGGELVNCGGHTATSCGECPEGKGYVELSQDQHCSSWELEKNEKNKDEITFSLLVN